MKRQEHNTSEKGETRRYRSRGVEVEISEARDRVELKLDGKPIHVSIVDGEIHCQLANQFTAFGSIDEVVDTLLANEGRTWTLHGHVCDERCREGRHHDSSRGKDLGHRHGRPPGEGGDR